VASCMQPGMSMAAVAMAHGVNANLLRRWVRDAETNSATTVVSATTAETPKAREAKEMFVPVSLPPSGQPSHVLDVRIGLRRGPTMPRWSGRRVPQRVRDLDARAASMIRVNAMRLAAAPSTCTPAPSARSGDLFAAVDADGEVHRRRAARPRRADDHEVLPRPPRALTASLRVRLPRRARPVARKN